MKKWTACLLIFLLLLTGCQPDDQISPNLDVSTSQEGELQGTDDKPIDDVTNQTLADDETDGHDGAQEALLNADDCLLNLRQPLSYDEFFAEDREYINNEFGTTDWAVPCEDGFIVFGTNWDWRKNGLYVSSSASEGKYYVPGADIFDGSYTLLAADGIYAYFQNTEEIVQLDMRTGGARQIVQSDYISDAYICGRDALYYAAAEDGKLSIKRLYIPTMQMDVLYDDFADDTPYTDQEFYMYRPESTQGDVRWYSVNPEMMKQVKKETADPNSAYKISEPGLDITILWEKGEEPNSLESRARLWLCYFIQDDTGIRTFLEGTYDQSRGTYSERLGIIDNCWFGSGYPHDHYNPELTEKDDPVPNIGEWIEIPNVELIQEDEGIFTQAYSDQFLPAALYRYEEGRLLEKLIDIPVIKSYGMYCITANNQLLQISSDGTVCNVLYEIKDSLREFNRYQDKLYFLDGDVLIELDLSSAKYRAILEYTGIVCMYLDNSDGTGEGAELYFEVGEGLFIAGYKYYAQTEEVVRAGYRL